MNQTTFIDPLTTVPAADGGNTGNGSMSIPVVSSATLTETITVACTVPGGSGVGQFSVTGSVSGALGTATSNVEFVDADQKMRFTITAGGTPWAVSDQFTFSTVAGTPTSEAKFNEFASRVGIPSVSRVVRFHDMLGPVLGNSPDVLGYFTNDFASLTQINNNSGVMEMFVNASGNISTIQGAAIGAGVSLNSNKRIFNSRVATGLTSLTNKRCIVGLADNTVAAMLATNTGKGLFFRIEAAGSAVNIFAVTKNGGSPAETTTDTGILDSATYREFEIRATSSSVEYYIDGVLVATHTTNIPTVAIHSRVSFVISENAAKRMACDWIYEDIPGARPT